MRVHRARVLGEVGGRGRGHGHASGRGGVDVLRGRHFGSVCDVGVVGVLLSLVLSSPWGESVRCVRAEGTEKRRWIG